MKTSFFKEHNLFCITAILAVILILIAILAPYITPYDPYETNMMQAYQAPSAAHWFGTDKLGRDVFSRVIYGTRISLPSTLLLVACVFVIGSVLGVVAGYFGGFTDTLIMRISDMMISFPGMVLAISVAGILGASIGNAIIALAVVGWTKYARLARSVTLKIKNQDYVAAAIVTGTRTPVILSKYIFVNALPTLIVTAAMDIGTMILELAGLSFLGFGAQAPIPEWGLMLNEGRQFMLAYPWLMIFPGLAICIVVIVFNLFGDSLRDILDPKNQG
ncbi:MAG: nickel transporter permease [Eubacteriaceae bacterium]|jgi:peptide/nickel transport system permease protein